MENQPKGLKELVAQQSYIIDDSLFFGLFHRFLYAPTASTLQFESRYYAPVLREELKELFASSDDAFEKRLAKLNRYEQAVNGNMQVECCFSKDREFGALRLMQYAQIDYQPVSEVRFLQGEAAKQAAKVFGF